jgi:multiple sugar transport system substrate-binding protein
VTPGKPFKGVEAECTDRGGATVPRHEARLAAFEELTGIRVKYQYVPFTSIRDKLTAEMVAENGDYDVVSVMDVWAPSLKNLLHPLNDGIRDKGIDMSRYPDAYLRASRNESGYIGLPIRGHVQLLFYRKDVLAELKLPVPRTWAEVVMVSQAISGRCRHAGHCHVLRQERGTEPDGLVRFPVGTRW